MQSAVSELPISVKSGNRITENAGIHGLIKSDEKVLSASHFRPVKLALAALFMCVIMMCAGCSGKTGKNSDTGSSVTERPLPTLTPAVTEKIEPTPGGESDISEAGQIQEKQPVLLYINEVLPTNSKYNKHHGGYYDAVELYNASEETLLLSDYYLSDSKKRLTDHQLPPIELAPDSYVVVYCTGEYHAENWFDLSFKLSYFGEKIYLADKDGDIIDTLQYPRLPQNVSIGRAGDGLKIYDTPSLGEPNIGGYERMAELPSVDLEPGFYDEVRTVRFTTEGLIRYTLDGSVPDSNSNVWDGEPIVISKTSSLRAYAEEAGCMDSFIATYDYFLNEPEYELDVLMLSVKDSDFEKINKDYSSNKKYAANISLFRAIAGSAFSAEPAGRMQRRVIRSVFRRNSDLRN